MQQYTLHMIGHGHIDPTWLWRWTEGFEEVRATFRSALARMREEPDFRFTASSACFYWWVQQTDPALFLEIRERVQEGRWEVAGGWWIEPDCNLPCGEAFVRQGLYGLRYFQREFNVRVRVGFNPDSFGHAGTLPQILKKLGQDYYAYQRPMPITEMQYPEGTTFFWESPDGSRVLATNLIESYNGNLETSERIRQWPKHPHLTPGQTHLLCFYGVGNHGGGPTKAAIAQIRAAQQDAEAPRVAFSTLQRYFEATESTLAEIPTIRNELQHHARGCYSAHAAVKRLNRSTEHALMTAERLSAALSMHTGIDYPGPSLEAAWKDLLYNQFHDILAGSSIESSYEDTRDQVGRARHTAHELINVAVQRLARQIDTTPAGNTVVVFNPLPWPVKVPVVVSPVLARELKQPLMLVDAEDQPVAMQPVRGESISMEAVAQARHTFVAELPALGYRCYHARDGVSEKPGQDDHMIRATPWSLENSWWRLELDAGTGELSRLFDKKHGVEVLRRGIFSVIVDSSDTWSHDITEYRLEAGHFSSPRFRVVEQGPVLATVQMVAHFHESTAVVEWTLYREIPDIVCNLRVDWREAYHLLKITFETGIKDGCATYETPYGHQVRPTNGHEQPGQQWLDLTGHIEGMPYGLSLLNDGQYGFDVLDGVMRVTALRSPAYAHHDVARVSLRDMPSIMDQRWHNIRLRLVPHAGPWQQARIPQQAWQHNVPPIPHCESAHPGPQPAQQSFLGMEADHVLLGVLKQHEDSGQWVLRAYETAGAAEEVTLHLPHLGIRHKLRFAPHEIKTLLLDTEEKTLIELNLLEELP